MTVEVVNLRFAVISGIKHVDGGGVVITDGQAQHSCLCRWCTCHEIRVECTYLYRCSFSVVDEIANIPELVIVDDIGIVGEGIRGGQRAYLRVVSCRAACLNDFAHRHTFSFFFAENRYADAINSCIATHKHWCASGNFLIVNPAQHYL